MSAEASLWAVVPAAGVGSRMAAECPKQYLMLNGRAVLQHSLEALLVLPALRGIAVAIAEHDSQWLTLPAASDARVRRAKGGAARSDSVLSGLDALTDVADDQDWVLVHDAARPCLALSDLQGLIDALADDDIGGLLALPVADTVKRADVDGRVQRTVDRAGLWLAQTPQMFRFKALRDALIGARDAGVSVTDEASAIEWAGYQPKLVPGSANNIKITLPADLVLAQRHLAAQGTE